jgi:hypothetical protein
MNKVPFLFLVSFLSFSINLFAQQDGDSSQRNRSTTIPTYRGLNKGAFTFALNGSADNNEQKAGWSLTPQAGYAVADRLVVGLQLSVANQFSKLGNSWTSLKRGGLKEYAFTPEVYARYYVLPFRLTPFVQLSSGYNIGECSTNNGFFSGDRTVIKTNNFVMFGAMGLSLRVGQHVGLQAQYNLPLIVDSQKNNMIRSNRFRLGVSLYFK